MCSLARIGEVPDLLMQPLCELQRLPPSSSVWWIADAGRVCASNFLRAKVWTCGSDWPFDLFAARLPGSFSACSTALKIRDFDAPYKFLRSFCDFYGFSFVVVVVVVVVVFFVL